jgi:hypothetical protein
MLCLSVRHQDTSAGRGHFEEENSTAKFPVSGFELAAFSLTFPGGDRVVDVRKLETPNSKLAFVSAAREYDPRYLRGVQLFNHGEYFDAHEVWEELWQDCSGVDRRFYQSLIQAAVALYHGGNGNRAGAARLLDSGRRYAQPYRPTHRGLDVDGFWAAVAAALAPVLTGDGPPQLPAPQIVLDPEPETWPDDPGVGHE